MGYSGISEYPFTKYTNQSRSVKIRPPYKDGSVLTILVKKVRHPAFTGGETRSAFVASYPRAVSQIPLEGPQPDYYG